MRIIIECFHPWECVYAGIQTVGKHVLVAGRSKNVGMPIAMLLHSDRNHERPGGKPVSLLVLLSPQVYRLNNIFIIFVENASCNITVFPELLSGYECLLQYLPFSPNIIYADACPTGSKEGSVKA